MDFTWFDVSVCVFVCVPLNRLFGRFSTFDEWVYGAVFACLHVCTRVYFPEKVHIINSSHHHHLEMEAHNIKFKANSGNFWLIFHYLFGYLWKDGLWQWIECACVLRVPHELSLQIYCWGLGWKMMVGKGQKWWKNVCDHHHRVCVSEKIASL